MADTIGLVDQESRQGGYAHVAISGTAWATGQTVLNKAATMAATLVISWYVTEDEMGAAALAIIVTKSLTILPPLNMGDVLIARSRSFALLRRPAARVVLLSGGLTALLLVVASPAVAWFYSDYPRTLLIGLLVVAALRPLGEAMAVPALTELRLSFQNRAIALIDGVVQLVGTVVSVLLACFGMGAWAVAVPPSLVVMAKALLYPVQCRRSGERAAERATERAAEAAHAPPSEDAQTATRLVRKEFAAASGAQYIHSMVDSLPVLFLGKLAMDAGQTGLYAFALSLSGQANQLISTQVSGVLQPVLGKLSHDPERQAKGFLRAMRTISALSVPMCLMQAYFSQTIFALIFAERWQPAAPIFAALSLCESFFFASAPTMAMLKAQGRFRTFLVWQCSQLVVALAVFPIAARQGGALPVAICSASLWALGLPIAVWLSIRHAGHTLWDAIKVFAMPWITAAPVGAAGWLAARALDGYGTPGRIATLALVAPATLALMMLAIKWVQPEVWRELTGMARAVARRLPVLRRCVAQPPDATP